MTNGEPVILFFHSAKENWQARIFFIGWQKHSPLLYLRWREDQFKQNIVPFRSFASSPNIDRQLMVIVKNNIYAGKSCSNHQEPLEEIVGKVAKALVDNFWQPFHPQLTCVVHSNFPETPLLRQACDAIMLWMASSMIQEVLPKTRAMGLMEIEKLPSCSEIWTTSSIFANRCFVVLREITFGFSLHFFTLLMLVKIPNFFFFIRSKN